MSTRSPAHASVSSTNSAPVAVGGLHRSQVYLVQSQTQELQSEQFEQSEATRTTDRSSSNFQHNFGRVPVRSTTFPIIQPKLVIGQPNDRYEQEADRVADQVMQMPASLSTPSMARSIQPLALTNNHSLQRQTESSDEEEEEKEEIVQAKAFPDLSIHSLNSQFQSTLQRQTEEDSDEEEVVQTKPASGQTVAPVNLQTQLHSSQSQGHPLSPSTRRLMEPRFNHDFSPVRVHTDRHAADLNQQIHAQAFTHGQHIYFGQGRYQPSTLTGQHLLAHELTHVVQQTGGQKIQPKRTEGRSTLTPSIAQSSLSRFQSNSGSILHPVISSTSNDLQKEEEEDLLDSALSFGGDLLESGVETVAEVTGVDIREYVDEIPGYTLFTVIIEYDPIRRRAVDRNAISLVEGLLRLLPPIGEYIFNTLQEHQILETAFNWVEEQLQNLDLSLERIQRAIDAFISDIGITDVLDVADIAQRHFGSLLQDVESFVRSLIDQLIVMIREVAVGLAEDLLDENPAWALLKKVLHYDPLRGEAVEATTVEILEDFLLLIDKQQELEQMRQRGTLQETADWLDTQFAIFTSLLAELISIFADAWSAIQPENLPNLMTNLQALATRVVGFLGRVWDFASSVALEVLRLIKRSLLNRLSSFAHEILGFHLLTVIAGRNPFTEEEVPLTPTNLIRGFMSLIPGGEEQFQQLQETGVIPEAAQRIETAMDELGISWEFVQGLFLDIWNAFTIDDLVQPIDAFTRVLDQFREPLNRLFTFVIEVVKVILELVLVLMHFPTDLIGSIITNALQALDDIQRDPVGFLINLLETMKLGFSNFFDNIVEHLIGGLANWLFSEVREAGIEPPTDLSFESILGFVMDILGLSMEHLWELLAQQVGQETVNRIRGAIDRLVGAWNFIQDVQERGIVAVWEYIESQLSNLWDMVLAQVQEWVMERVINVGMRWLMSFLDVTGITPVINSFIAVFNAIQSAIEYLNEILAVINDFVSTVASIARGDIQPGAERMELGLSNSLPIMIGFLAYQFGLDNIGERLQEIIAGARELIDAGFIWLIQQALRLGQAVLRSLGLGGDTNSDAHPDEPLHTGGESPPIVRNFDFLGEDHSLRLGVTGDGDVKVTMASEDWGNFPQVLTNLKERQVARLREDNRAEEANELERELQSLVDEAIAVGSPGGPVQQAKTNYLRQLNNLPSAQQGEWIEDHGDLTDAMRNAWDEHYYEFLRRLQDLDNRYDFSGGRQGVIAVGDDFVDRTRNILMRVSGVNVRQGSLYGIKAYPANSSSSAQDSFYTYDTYAVIGLGGWGPLGSAPPLLPYPSSGISPSSLTWRSATRHVVINDVTRRRGTPSNSRENVPGVVSTSINPTWKYVARGHLIANVLGGPGHFLSGNIVPMTVDANNSQMKSKLENRVLDIFEDDPWKNDPLKRTIVDVQVTPRGWNAAGTIPLTVDLQYKKIYPTPEPTVTDTINNS